MRVPLPLRTLRPGILLLAFVSLAGQMPAEARPTVAAAYLIGDCTLLGRAPCVAGGPLSWALPGGANTDSVPAGGLRWAAPLGAWASRLARMRAHAATAVSAARALLREWACAMQVRFTPSVGIAACAKFCRLASHSCFSK